VWDVPKALIQSQSPRGADSETVNGAQDFELYYRRVPIVIGTVNTEDNASPRSVPRLHFEAIDIRRYPTGNPKCPHEPHIRQVRSDNRFKGAVDQYSLSSGSLWRDVRHCQSILASLRWHCHIFDRFLCASADGQFSTEVERRLREEMSEGKGRPLPFAARVQLYSINDRYRRTPARRKWLLRRLDLAEAV
jgi:hypothetical protein